MTVERDCLTLNSQWCPAVKHERDVGESVALLWRLALLDLLGGFRSPVLPFTHFVSTILHWNKLSSVKLNHYRCRSLSPRLSQSLQSLPPVTVIATCPPCYKTLIFLSTLFTRPPHLRRLRQTECNDPSASRRSIWEPVLCNTFLAIKWHIKVKSVYFNGK